MMESVRRILEYFGVFSPERQRELGEIVLLNASNGLSREVRLGVRKIILRHRRGGPLRSSHAERAHVVISHYLRDVYSRVSVEVAQSGILSLVFGHGKTLRGYRRALGFGQDLLRRVK